MEELAHGSALPVFHCQELIPRPRREVAQALFMGRPADESVQTALEMYRCMTHTTRLSVTS